jgi:hypothetical protein
MALLPGRPSPALTPAATQIRPYLPCRPNSHQVHIAPTDMIVLEDYLALKRNIGLAEREILMMV